MKQPVSKKLSTPLRALDNLVDGEITQPQNYDLEIPFSFPTDDRFSLLEILAKKKKERKKRTRVHRYSC